MSISGWVGVDLDGTLAMYEGWKSHEHIGEPIPEMLERVKRWLADGVEVRIFTARISGSDPKLREVGQCEIENAIKEWCQKHLGQQLVITNIKDYAMIELWDDRAVQVEPNTGRPIGQSTRGLK